MSDVIAQSRSYIPALLLITPSLLSLATVSAMRELYSTATKVYCRTLIAISLASLILSISSILGLAAHPFSSLAADIVYAILQGLGTGLSLITITVCTTRTGLLCLINIVFNKACYKVNLATTIAIIFLPTLFTLFEIAARLCNLDAFGMSILVHHGIYFSASAVMLLNKILVVLGMTGILMEVDLDVKKRETYIPTYLFILSVYGLSYSIARLAISNFTVTLTYQILLTVENFLYLAIFFLIIIYQSIGHSEDTTRPKTNSMMKFSYRHHSNPIHAEEAKEDVSWQLDAAKVETIHQNLESLRSSYATTASFQAGHSSTVDADSVDANINNLIIELKSQRSDPILDYRLATIYNSQKTLDSAIQHSDRESPSSIWTTFQQKSKFMLDNLANESNESFNYI